MGITAMILTGDVGHYPTPLSLNSELRDKSVAYRVNHFSQPYAHLHGLSHSPSLVLDLFYLLRTRKRIEMATAQRKDDTKPAPKLKWWDDSHTRRLALQSRAALHERQNKVNACIRRESDEFGRNGRSEPDRYDGFVALLLEDVAHELALALDSRLAIRELTSDADVEFHLAKSLYLAVVEPELARVHEGFDLHRHVGAWTQDTYETSIKYILESLSPLEAIFGKVFEPRKWCSKPSNAYNEDPSLGPLFGGITALRVSEGYPMTVQVL